MSVNEPKRRKPDLCSSLGAIPPRLPPLNLPYSFSLTLHYHYLINIYMTFLSQGHAGIPWTTGSNATDEAFGKLNWS